MLHLRNFAFAALFGLCFSVAAAPAQALDFGDNASQYADDDECDDPRFEGEGVDDVLLPDDQLHDSADCQALFDAGKVTYRAGAAIAIGAIDFGDNSSSYANDDECDDPRFEGEGVASSPSFTDLGHDANDCRTLFKAGKASYLLVKRVGSDGVDFGDNSSTFANDSRCDDGRFTGFGMADTIIEADTLRDAEDCRTYFEAGLIGLALTDPAAAEVVADVASGLVFGDNTSDYANDGECDDPRFTGAGMASSLSSTHFKHDAADCKTLFDAGSITYLYTPIDFGDNSSDYQNDGECDDDRFVGEGMAESPSADHRMRDEADCRMFFDAGKITLAAAAATVAKVDASNVDFGANDGEWVDDGECDDPRFAGEGMAAELFDTDILHDANDCRALFEAGKITLKDGAGGQPAVQAADIDFGDDTAAFAKDGECDDPRFEGEGVAATTPESDRGHDATDCRTAFEAGTATLKAGEA